MNKVVLPNKNLGYEIKGFPDYFIDKVGNIYSLKNPRFHRNKEGLHRIKPISSFGYKRVNIYKNGKGSYRRIHCLMLETFIGPRPKGMCARHLNDIRDDNRIENLKWGTASENYNDAIKNKKIKLGEDRPNSKLTNKQVIEIRKLKDKFTYLEISKKYNVSKATITHIMTRRNWKNTK